MWPVQNVGSARGPCSFFCLWRVVAGGLERAQGTHRMVAQIGGRARLPAQNPPKSDQIGPKEPALGDLPGGFCGAWVLGARVWPEGCQGTARAASQRRWTAEWARGRGPMRGGQPKSAEISSNRVKSVDFGKICAFYVVARVAKAAGRAGGCRGEPRAASHTHRAAEWLRQQGPVRGGQPKSAQISPNHVNFKNAQNDPNRVPSRRVGVPGPRGGQGGGLGWVRGGFCKSG